jgi:hypothetical protein
MSSKAIRFVVQMPDLPLTEFRLLVLIANDADEHGFAPQDVEKWRKELSRFGRYQHVAQKLAFWR